MKHSDITKEVAEQYIDGLMRSGGGCWMGIEVEWVRTPKYSGGKSKYKNQWGNWRYFDYFSDKEMTFEQAVSEILVSPEERKSKSDLLKIKYCINCGEIGVGENELQLWGHIQYVYATKTYKYNSSPDYVQTLHKWADICPKCCKEIVNK